MSLWRGLEQIAASAEGREGKQAGVQAPGAQGGRPNVPSGPCLPPGGRNAHPERGSGPAPLNSIKHGSRGTPTLPFRGLSRNESTGERGFPQQRAGLEDREQSATVQAQDARGQAAPREGPVSEAHVDPPRPRSHLSSRRPGAQPTAKPREPAVLRVPVPLMSGDPSCRLTVGPSLRPWSSHPPSCRAHLSGCPLQSPARGNHLPG